MRTNQISRLMVVAVILGMSGMAVHAGSYANNFNSDPGADPNFSVRPSAKWVAAGSHDGSGYISLTDAIGAQQGTIVLPDIDGGAGVTAFNIKMKVRIGGGTARPADGMSVSFADATDPIIAGGTVGEEGTTTGLSVNLDTWDNGNGDGPAIDIKVDGVVVAHKRFAGSGPQTTSPGPLCTPLERDAAGNPIAIGTGLGWTDLEVNLTTAGAVSVRYKGMDIFKDVPSGYGAKGIRSGRFVIAGRTGNAWDNHWIDDLEVTTDNSDAPPRLGVPTLPAGNPAHDVVETTPVEFVIDASGTFYDLVQSSVRLTIDGTDVTGDPGTVITDDPVNRITTVRHTPSMPYAAGSRHEAVLTYNDNNDPANHGLGRKVFHVSPVVGSSPAGNTLFIEAEDFNYTDGTSAGLFFDFGAPNGSYDGRAALHDTDYHLNASNPDSPVYRVLNPPNGISVPGAPDNLRAGTPITPDYKVGWNDAGDWFNFTRTFPNTTYKIYARLASGGADSHAQLARVSGDPTTPNQTATSLGTFDGEATGGWDTFCFIPLRDASGNEVIVRLNGLTTLRLTVLPGNYDANYLAFVPTPTAVICPSVVAVEPAPNSESLRDPKIKAVINDADTPVDPASIRLFLDGTELTPITVTDTPGGAEVEHQVTTGLAPGTTHTASVRFNDSDPASNCEKEQSWTFTVGNFKSGSGTLFIEAEDFNYSDADGVNPGQHANFGDPDCSLLGKDATLGIDYNEANDGNDQAVYRAPTGVEAGKPGTDGFQRGDHVITCSYIVGWNDNGDWYNYTRDFGPSARWNVYARMSSGGAAENAELALITSDPTQPGQTKQPLGQFNSPATGNWDIFHTVPLRDGSGNLASVRLDGLTTLRFSVLPGNLDVNYLAFVKADVQTVTPTVESVFPRPGADSERAPRITAAIKDEDTAVVASSVRISFNGADVTAYATVSDTDRGASVSFQSPERIPVGNVNTVTISWEDNQGTPGSFTWTYTEGIHNADKNLFIEMEDFNTANGSYIPSSAGIPFNAKNLYNTLGATAGVDYNDAGDGHESDQYRTEGDAAGNPHVNMVPTPDVIGGQPRHTPDYKIGWTNPNTDWYNYTRDYGAGGNFFVFLRASHGDATQTIGGRLETVDDATSTTQTTAPLGSFRAPATGGWDTFTFIPLRDGAGNMAQVSLSGVQTLRYTVEANGGDVNFLMLCPVLVNQCPTANNSSATVDQGGTVSFQLQASDPNGDYLTYTVTQAPTQGTLTVNAQTGAATYTANANACGDSFRFKVNDGECDSAEATVTITVNDRTPPVVVCPPSMTVGEGEPVTITPPTGTDDCSGSLAADCRRADGRPLSDPFPLGDTAITCTVTDGGGNQASCSFTVTVVRRNADPVCDAKLTPSDCGITFTAGGQLYTIAVKHDYVCVTLDGSRTSDPDGDPVTITWVIDGTNVVNGAVVTNCLDVGCHEITMMASDGRGGQCHAFIDICVITPSEAVEQLITAVENTTLERKKKRPLLVSLKAAKAAFDREGWKVGALMLRVFQFKVQAQIGRSDPAAAQAFVQAAENIISAIKCVIKQPRKGDDDGDDDDDRNNDDDDGPNNGGGHNNHGDDDDGRGRGDDDDGGDDD